MINDDENYDDNASTVDNLPSSKLNFGFNDDSYDEDNQPSQKTYVCL